MNLELFERSIGRFSSGVYTFFIKLPLIDKFDFRQGMVL